MTRPAFHSVAVRLPVLLLKERRTFIAYTPALDLSAHGSTADRARKNFENVLRLFLEELVAHGTLDRVLRELGWSRQGHQWQPPIQMTCATFVPFCVPAA